MKKWFRISILEVSVPAIVLSALAISFISPAPSDAKPQPAALYPVTVGATRVDSRAHFTLTNEDTQARLNRADERLDEYVLLDADAKEDKTRPLYEVYKNGYRVNAPADIQWMIRDLAAEHGYDEKIIFGMVVMESTFNPRAIGGTRCITHHAACLRSCSGACEADDSSCVFKGRWFGLTQTVPYWLTANSLKDYRLTDDPAIRDLMDPYDNLVTCLETWNYAREVYGLDLDTELGWVQLLYFHNTGHDPSRVTRWAYAAKIFEYANELVEVQKRVDFTDYYVD